MLNSAASRISRHAGFSLVELLVGMAVGLIVLAAALAFISSSLQANSDMLRSIRLNQELRALTEIVAREVRRARFRDLSVTDIVQGPGSTPSPFNDVCIDGACNADATGECLRFSYEPVEELQAKADLPAGRAFWRDTQSIGGVDRGRVFAARAAIPIACANGAAISSPEVDITRFDVTYNNTQSIVDLLIEGRLVNDPDGIVRGLSQRIRIRSSTVPVTAPPVTP